MDVALQMTEPYHDIDSENVIIFLSIILDNIIIMILSVFLQFALRGSPSVNPAFRILCTMLQLMYVA